MCKVSAENVTTVSVCVFIQDNEAADGLYSLLSLEQKRDSEDFIFRRPLSKCSSKQWLYSAADCAYSLGKQQVTLYPSLKVC